VRWGAEVGVAGDGAGGRHPEAQRQSGDEGAGFAGVKGRLERRKVVRRIGSTELLEDR